MESQSSIRNRFKDANWFGSTESLLIGGCGGIGSWFTFFAARAGFNLFVYDHDLVEEHNLGGQLYHQKHIGLHKVKAMQELCQQFSDSRINIIDERYTDQSESNNIMIGCFDNMEARKDFYNNWKKHVLSLPENMRFKCLLIDGRLEAETFQIFCITPDTMEKYEQEALFNDNEVQTEASCTLKQTSHMASMIGGQMLGYLTNFLSNVKIMNNIRKVPYFTEYAMAIGYHNTILC